jgi:hypothetical protein
MHWRRTTSAADQVLFRRRRSLLSMKIGALCPVGYIEKSDVQPLKQLVDRLWKLNDDG